MPQSPAAILAAGGIGERARSSSAEAPKQFQTLGGKPVIRWALDALLEAGCDPIVAVVPETWTDEAKASLEIPGLELRTGGPTRQDSIHNGLEAVTSPAVVVQDASRPLVTAELIRRVIEGLQDADAVVAAVPMDETLKRADGDYVVETVDRSTIWKAQTPAAFKTAVLKEAHRRAIEEGFIGTDESQLIERAGGRVAIVPGSRHNLKITWAEDFELAEAILKTRHG